MSNSTESLVNEAKKCKKLPNLIWAIILCMIFMFGGSLLGQFSTLPIYFLLNSVQYFKVNQELLMLLMSLLTFLLISLIVFFRIIKIEKRS